MAEALALNPRLRGEYFVRHFAGCRQDFLLAPGSEREAEAADQAVSLDRGRRRRRSQVTASRGRCAAER